MNSEELRSQQAPLKNKYRENPAEALITLHAEGGLGDGVSCSIDTGKALIEAGLHPATGGGGAASMLRRHAASSVGCVRGCDFVRGCYCIGHFY